MSGGRAAKLLGQWGEALVAQDLRQKGWTIVESGFRCRYGELDLVAENGEYLVFFEVKLRKGYQFAPAAAFVDRRKQERLYYAAQSYLLQCATRLQPRFDVAEVYAPRGTATVCPVIHYLENAF